MSTIQPRRVMKSLSPEEQSRLTELRQQVAKEMPDLVARDQLRKEASQETTVSGILRRAIHKSPMRLDQIAAQVGVTSSALDGFLTGERTLRSDVIDRLAMTMSLELHDAIEKQ